MSMRLPLAAALVVACGALAGAEEPAPQPSPSPAPPAHWQESVQVTATRIPESVREVPAAIDVVTGEDLRDRGATTLREGLSLSAGVEVAPGGDGGPASSVPEFWGLKEFDAFLMVVDGVPWGGAFNPALASLDLKNVDRIEVQRGAAPVMYGATSFVGVVQVVRRAPGQVQNEASVYGGSYDTGGGALSARLPGQGPWASAVSADFTRQGFKDDRTSFQRGHVLWRSARTGSSDVFHFDVDGTWLRQDPASPHVRQGKTLSTVTPLDANYNPEGARLDEDRYFLNAGYDRNLSFGTWNTVLSFTHSGQDQLRGFLADVSSAAPNANGFEAEIDTNDLYFDTHLAFTRSARFKGVLGADYLHGQADAEGNVFSYFVNLDGTGAPDEEQLVLGEDRAIADKRNFAGLYAFGEWNPSARLKLEGGLRLNHTEEERGEGEADQGGDAGEAKQDNTRLSGSAALGFTLWERGGDRLRAFAAYKNTFKPAAIDFNLAEDGGEGEGILEPETAQSYEAGLQADLAGGRGRAEVSAFLMDFDNLVISQAVNGLPALENAGTERFKGIESSLSWRLPADFWVRGTYACHDARFQDYLTEFDGVPTQLGGKRLEMSAHHLASGAIVRAPARGLVATLEGRYVGQRFLNKRNTAPAEGYTAFDASLGWRGARYELRAFGRNLGDRRDPVSESELGDAQYYRMTARRFDVLASFRF